MHEDPIDNIIKGERLVNTPGIRDLVEQATAAASGREVE